MFNLRLIATASTRFSVHERAVATQQIRDPRRHQVQARRGEFALRTSRFLAKALHSTARIAKDFTVPTRRHNPFDPPHEECGRPAAGTIFLDVWREFELDQIVAGEDHVAIVRRTVQRTS